MLMRSHGGYLPANNIELSGGSCGMSHASIFLYTLHTMKLLLHPALILNLDWGLQGPWNQVPTAVPNMSTFAVYHLILLMFYSATVKMEMIRSSETAVYFKNLGIKKVLPHLYEEPFFIG
jgi:hypothetical protein